MTLSDESHARINAVVDEAFDIETVTWREVADRLVNALAMREQYSQHSENCHTCRYMKRVDLCEEGWNLYPEALIATAAAAGLYGMVKQRDQKQEEVPYACD